MADAPTWSRREVWRRKLLYPGHTLPTAVAPVLVAVGVAVREGRARALPALLALLCGWLIQVGGVLTDNHQNLVDEPEDREHPELVRALREGTLSLAELRRAIAVCFGVALLAGVVLLAMAGPFVVIIGLASMAAAWAYSAGPLPLGKLGVADPLFFAFFGIVSVAGSVYVQVASLAPAPWSGWVVAEAVSPLSLVAAVPVGAITTCILIVDDIRDRQFDREKGKRTIAVRLGRGASRAEYLVLMLVAYLVPMALWRLWPLSGWALLPLASLPLAAGLLRDVWRLDGYEPLLPLSPRTGRLLVVYCALWAVGLGLS